jgi:hypothetical protein
MLARSGSQSCVRTTLHDRRRLFQVSVRGRRDYPIITSGTLPCSFGPSYLPRTGWMASFEDDQGRREEIQATGALPFIQRRPPTQADVPPWSVFRANIKLGILAIGFTQAEGIRDRGSMWCNTSINTR